MLYLPNIYWPKHLPEDYIKYANNENKIQKEVAYILYIR